MAPVVIIWIKANFSSAPISNHINLHVPLSSSFLLLVFLLSPQCVSRYEIFNKLPTSWHVIYVCALKHITDNECVVLGFCNQAECWPRAVHELCEDFCLNILYLFLLGSHRKSGGPND